LIKSGPQRTVLAAIPHFDGFTPRSGDWFIGILRRVCRRQHTARPYNPIEETSTMSELGMLTPTNSAIALIDFQPAMYQGVQSHDRLVPFNNV
jgi:hypothetical protein